MALPFKFKVRIDTERSGDLVFMTGRKTFTLKDLSFPLRETRALATLTTAMARNAEDEHFIPWTDLRKQDWVLYIDKTGNCCAIELLRIGLKQDQQRMLRWTGRFTDFQGAVTTLEKVAALKFFFGYRN